MILVCGVMLVWFGVPGWCGVCRLFVGQFVGVSGCVVFVNRLVCGKLTVGSLVLCLVVV